MIHEGHIQYFTDKTQGDTAMEESKEQLQVIFQKTNGVCRICRGTEGPKLKFEHYGKEDEADGWEIEQTSGKSAPVDERWAVHISCNLHKGTGIKKTRKSHHPAAVLVPEQDMEIERWQAQLRGNAGL
jgi:hypothetical protein